MDRPAEILDGLIDPQEVFSSLIGAKAIMLYFQTPQHPHARFGQRVAY